ncbi:Gamma-glutamyl hydrolase [Anabarilius grahami]|uniref:folate gamma-glutamyl hydrolase n=1 Tax=Anabarilius grahami TaxID=495550 RepID=A0A3N0XND0_ANAGA|nr:Gamma-glutamyl hydrolase [Anabarilius grahami]
MGFSALVCACVLAFCSAAPAKHLQRNEPENNRPIIGILTQEVDIEAMEIFGKTYIPSSYVKYIESGGARVVPISLILIGGSVNLETSDFAHTAGIYFRLALKAHDEGEYFPIWGTCLGFQLLTVLVAGENLLSKTTAENVTYPLNFSSEAQSSRMFANIPPDLRKALSQEPLTANFHHYGVTKEAFMGNEKLKDFFSVLSTNIAENGLEFVSTMEGRKHPFYGVQWHPEVNRFQWDPRYNFPHSSNAVRISSVLAEFFVNEGRRSSHHFSEAAEESRALIYNYNPVYVANISAYEQSYFF